MTDKIKLTSMEVHRAKQRIQLELTYGTNLDQFLEKYKIGETSSGIAVIKHSDLLHAQCSVLAGCLSLAMTDGTKSKPFIVVDDYFMDTPGSIQKWIIYHELGHIHNKHLEMSGVKSYLTTCSRAILSIIGCTTKMELEADKYAAEHTSVIKSMRVLEWMQRHIASINSKTECIGRKRNIMALTK